MDATDFQDFSLRLIRASQKHIDQGVRLLQREVPDVVNQLRSDCARGGPLSFWGRSLNVDELAGETIVSPQVIEILAAVAKRKISPKTPHAGIQHAYGYLFSTVETPYGFKRERWTETAIEDSFGLSESTLGPDPKSGTLLANATVFAGLIAYRTNAAERNRLCELLHDRVAPELWQFDNSRVGHQRLEETVSAVWRGNRRTWSLQTDIITSPHKSKQSVLIYSIVDRVRESHELVTLFPVGQPGIDELLLRAEVRRRDDIRLRFNAYVPALVGRMMKGTVRLTRLA